MTRPVFFEGLAQSPNILNGNIKFSGLTHRSAKYIIAKDGTSPKHVLFEMTARDKWNLTKPKLILSLTGGLKKLNLSIKMKKLIKRGIVKVSESTKSWILTSGSNNCVSKMIGEALAEHPKFSEFITIGILNLNRVALRNELVTLAKIDEHLNKQVAK